MRICLYKGKPVTVQKNACVISACLIKRIVQEQDRELWNIRIAATGNEQCEWFPLTIPDGSVCT